MNGKLPDRGPSDGLPEPDRTIHLPCYGMTIRLGREGTPGKSGGAAITSDLRDPDADQLYLAAIDAIESLVLAHACAGIDVASPAYVEGIETAVAAIANHL